MEWAVAGPGPTGGEGRSTSSWYRVDRDPG